MQRPGRKNDRAFLCLTLIHREEREMKNIRCRKGGKQVFPVGSDASGRCSNGDAFSKVVSSLNDKYSSIPIGWILRLDRRGCWFEPSLLYMVCSSNGSGHKIFILVIRVQLPYRLQWFVGVMVNITDCRSVAMSSILIRTAIMQHMH